MEDVDEVCDRQHACERKKNLFSTLFLLHFNLLSPLLILALAVWVLRVCRPLNLLALPTNLCSLLSHKGAALRPFATSAKKAFFTFRKVINVRGFTRTKDAPHTFNFLYFPYETQEACKILLVVWCQIWPVYSWLEWLHSSSGFSWNSCRWCRHPLWEKHVIKARTLAGQILTVTGKYCTILRYMSFIFYFLLLNVFFWSTFRKRWHTHTHRSTDTHSSQIVVVAYSDIIDWILS